MSATGTAGVVAGMVAATVEIKCSEVRLSEKLDATARPGADRPNLLAAPQLGPDREQLITGDSTSGGWDRTSDTRLMKPLL